MTDTVPWPHRDETLDSSRGFTGATLLPSAQGWFWSQLCRQMEMRAPTAALDELSDEALRTVDEMAGGWCDTEEASCAGGDGGPPPGPAEAVATSAG